jgi:antibiotic biosynthesis monooxygenase (ABM) superfamily enzyme
MIETLVEFFLNNEGRQRFSAWVHHVGAKASQYPGFIDIRQLTPLDEPDRCLFLLSFDTNPHVEQWVNSPHRQEVLAEMKPYWTDDYRPMKFLASQSWTAAPT